MFVCVYLNYFAVQKKLTHCKSIIFQKTKIKKICIHTHTQWNTTQP